MSRPAYLYLIAAVGENNPRPVKVGVSSNPQARLSTLQTGNPAKLEVYTTFMFADRRMALELEREVLDEMRPYVIRSGEWVDADAFGMRWLMHDAIVRKFTLSGMPVPEDVWQL